MAEIRPLTGLRGGAALCVFLAHLHDTLGEYGLVIDVPEWVRRLFLNGGPDVDVFFVLSGFILALNYRSWFADSITPAAYGTFLRRRFARIYPLHFVMLLLVIGFVAAAHMSGAATSHGLGRFDLHELPAYFLLMQAWGVFFPGPGNWNPPSWSVSIEALAYLFFPLVIWCAARYARRAPARWAALPIALAVAAGLALNALTPWGLSGFEGIARGLSEFILGCTVIALYESPLATWFQRDVPSLIALAGLVVCVLLTPTTGFAVAICAVPVLLALSKTSLAGRFFAWQPVFFLGEISYSIYLGHFLFSSIAYRIVRIDWMQTGPWQTAGGVALIIAFVLVLSTLCYYGIERPGRTLLGGRRKARSAA
jgi:peptidoglycan/LPS O-acetylase OafA/YrhL